MQELARLAHFFTTATHGPWVYAVVGLAAAFDAIFPIVPSETLLISAAVLSARPHGPALWGLVVAGAAGAVAGDNLMYWLGRLVGERAVSRLARGPVATRRVEWASSMVRRYGPALVVVGRYIPGGRTAVTLASGTLAMPWGRFLIADVVAGVTWALYACLIGRVGGELFDSTWVAILVSAGGAVVLGLIFEGVRRLANRLRAPGQAGSP